MYYVYRKATIENASSGKVYTITLRKWDTTVSPYEIVYCVDDTENVYEYGDFDSAHAMFMLFPTGTLTFQILMYTMLRKEVEL